MCLLERKAEMLVIYYFMSSCVLQKSRLLNVGDSFTELLSQILGRLTSSSFLISISTEAALCSLLVALLSMIDEGC